MAEDRDYDIGKGKPPPWSRFRKGKSGNPKGRPRKKTKADMATGLAEFDRLYLSQLERTYSAQDGDRTVDITGLEVVMRAQFKAAAKGSSFAQREVLRNTQEAQAREQRRRELAEREESEFFAKVVKFKDLRTTIWDAAERDGVEPDDWPHPDDILIDHARKTWRIRGPMSDEDLHLFEYMRAVRDLAFIEAELALRQRGKVGVILSGIWDIAWIRRDVELPLAWQILPDLESRLFDLALNDTRRLRRLRDQWEAESESLRTRAGVPWRTKEVYREVNEIMKPLLRAHGYRSLAQLEAEHGKIGFSKLGH